MSKFSTTFPIEIETITAKLPAGSRITRLEHLPDARAFEVEWENDALKTPYLVATPYSIEQIAAGEVPGCVARPAPAPEPAIEPEIITDATDSQSATLTLKEVVDKPDKKSNKQRK